MKNFKKSFLTLTNGLKSSTEKIRSTVGNTGPDRLLLQCSGGVCRGGCFLLHSRENRPSPEGLSNIKNPQFQEKKISARIRARSHVTMKKSSKNHISLFGGKPARVLPSHPPPTAQRNRTFNTWKMCECDVRTRFQLAGLGRGEWGGGGGEMRNDAIR
jgi:hypothetical protein